MRSAFSYCHSAAALCIWLSFLFTSEEVFLIILFAAPLLELAWYFSYFLGENMLF